MDNVSRTGTSPNFVAKQGLGWQHAHVVLAKRFEFCNDGLSYCSNVCHSWAALFVRLFMERLFRFSVFNNFHEDSYEY